VVKGEGDDLSAGRLGQRQGLVTPPPRRSLASRSTAPRRTPPASVPAALANGWHGPSTEVTLAATDNLSGVAKTFYKVGTGAAQEYTRPFTHSVKGVSTITYWSTDVAGNTEGEKTLELKLDGTAPTSAIDLPEAFATGWYADSVPVAFRATDGESGVAKTFYKVGDGPAQQWDGTFDHVLSGTSTISYWSVDAVGNAEAAKSHEIKVDTSVPTITGSRTPAANGFGWNNETVTVSFVCEDSQSGVAIANCTPATPVVNEGAGQSVVGVAKDNVGKTATTTVGGINIDKTCPDLTGALPTTGRTASGWYKAPVTVAWTGDDNLSGIDPATQPAPAPSPVRARTSAPPPASRTRPATPATARSPASRSTPRSRSSTARSSTTTAPPARRTQPAGSTSAVRVRYSATDTCPACRRSLRHGPVRGRCRSDRDWLGQRQRRQHRLHDGHRHQHRQQGADSEREHPVRGQERLLPRRQGDSRRSTAAIRPACPGSRTCLQHGRRQDLDDAGGARAASTSRSTARGKVSVQFKAADKAGNVETVNTIEVKYDTSPRPSATSVAPRRTRPAGTTPTPR
jgi:hypothetical protein